MMNPIANRQPVRTYFWNNAKTRSYIVQFLILALLGWLLLEIIWNTSANLSRMNQSFGFAFLNKPAGFEVVQSFVSYTSEASYGRALLVGLLNTVFVSVLCIVAATAFGFLIGIMRLSRNRLAQLVAGLYIEFFRNVPVLLQIFIWYSLIILQVLPQPRDAIDFFGIGFLSNRGLVVPRVVFGDGAALALMGSGLAIVAVLALCVWARRRHERTGKRIAVVPTALSILVLLPLAGLAVAGFPVSVEVPVKTAFNFRGGMFVLPELMALFLALSIYYATYIAEAVRAGIQSVSHGQTEASQALGISRSDSLWKVIIPQAMRVVIPPLISIYLGITKTSSLAVAIGYPDLVAVGGTVLNQTGKAIEVVTIWMAVYLGLSLLTSLLMNWANARMQLLER
ncbi:ABC transporter permease subunit [Agrobacterium tumefaciens]|uniref:amino acid ABC transporter permease n=1 Tax=Agrobacterium tumefaciens TaxID=358 RepID=UPI0012B7068C|nr:ABC transporter permease subunit [Agrobacterium tumefaciens]MQB07304.1 ABC transporter permease subunit [Agrobacterium tumefaciens]